MLGRREPPVERHQHRAKARAGEQYRQHLRRIKAKKRNPVAAGYSQIVAQHGSHATNMRSEDPVGNIAAFKTDRGLIRLKIGPAFDPVGDIH